MPSLLAEVLIEPFTESPGMRALGRLLGNTYEVGAKSVITAGQALATFAVKVETGSQLSSRPLGVSDELNSGFYSSYSAVPREQVLEASTQWTADIAHRADHLRDKIERNNKWVQKELAP